MSKIILNKLKKPEKFLVKAVCIKVFFYAGLQCGAETTTSTNLSQWESPGDRCLQFGVFQWADWLLLTSLVGAEVQGWRCRPSNASDGSWINFPLSLALSLSLQEEQPSHFHLVFCLLIHAKASVCLSLISFLARPLVHVNTKCNYMHVLVWGWRFNMLFTVYNALWDLPCEHFQRPVYCSCSWFICFFYTVFFSIFFLYCRFV